MKIGWMGLADLPEPYRAAFETGTIHTGPGRFLPISLDIPGRILIALLLGPLCLIPQLLILAKVIADPAVVPRFLERVLREGFPTNWVVIGLLLLIGALLLFFGLMGYRMLRELYLAIQEGLSRSQGRHHYGLVLDSQNLVFRIIDSDTGHPCLFLPKAAVRSVDWRQMREEDAKRSKLVYRTIVEYETPEGQVVGATVYGRYFEASDRALYDAIQIWWRS